MTIRSTTTQDVNKIYVLLPVEREVSTAVKSYTSMGMFDTVKLKFFTKNIFFPGKYVCGIPVALFTVAALGLILTGIAYAYASGNADLGFISGGSKFMIPMDGTVVNSMHAPVFNKW